MELSSIFMAMVYLFFFDPLDGPIKPVAQRAINCSLEMQREMELFNAEMKIENLPELQIGLVLTSAMLLWETLVRK